MPTTASIKSIDPVERLTETNGHAPSTLPDTCMVHAIFPGDTNHYGTLFGGQAMAWMDQAAFICATR